MLELRMRRKGPRGYGVNDVLPSLLDQHDVDIHNVSCYDRVPEQWKYMLFRYHSPILCTKTSASFLCALACTFGLVFGAYFAQCSLNLCSYLLQDAQRFACIFHIMHGIFFSIKRKISCHVRMPLYRRG